MAEPPPLRLPLLSPAWRLLIAVLFAVAAVNLPFSLAATILMTDPPVTPPVLLRSLLLFSVLPAATAALLLRLFRAGVSARDGALEIQRTGLHLELPCRAIAGLRPWCIPLPGSGLSLRLASGQRLPYGFRAKDLDALLDLLERCGVDTSAARSHPSVRFARERRRFRRVGRVRILVKYAGFGALPAAVLFYTHQHIAYGGTFGQYYLYGLAAYLETASIYWLLTAIYLALYASVWRGLAEGAALAAAWLGPAHAGPVRQAAERTCWLLYYGGVPLLLLYRYSD